MHQGLDLHHCLSHFLAHLKFHLPGREHLELEDIDHLLHVFHLLSLFCAFLTRPSLQHVYTFVLQIYCLFEPLMRTHLIDYVDKVV